MSKKILFVEDELFWQQINRHVAEELGDRFECMFISNYCDAMDIIREQTRALAFVASDMRILLADGNGKPGRYGQEIVGNAHFSGIPSLAVSSDFLDKEKRLFEKVGIPMLPKSYDADYPAKLKAKILALLPESEPSSCTESAPAPEQRRSLRPATTYKKAAP